MAVDAAPFFKAKQRILIFKNEVIRDRKELLIRMRKTLLYILCNAQLVTDGIQQIGSTVKASCCFNSRNGTPLNKNRSCIVFTASAVSRYYFARFLVHSAYKSTP